MELLKLRDLLKEREITGKEFAEAMGFSTNTASNLINGKSFPAGKDLKAIADFLDVDIKDLFNQTKGTAPLNGFVEYEGEIYRIKEIKDLDLLKEKVEVQNKY